MQGLWRHGHQGDGHEDSPDFDAFQRSKSEADRRSTFIRYEKNTNHASIFCMMARTASPSDCPLDFVVLQVIQGLGHEARARTVPQCREIILS